METSIGRKTNPIEQGMGILQVRETGRMRTDKNMTRREPIITIVGIWIWRKKRKRPTRIEK